MVSMPQTAVMFVDWFNGHNLRMLVADVPNVGSVFRCGPFQCCAQCELNQVALMYRVSSGRHFLYVCLFQ
jgi:hypothetical protein